MSKSQLASLSLLLVLAIVAPLALCHSSTYNAREIAAKIDSTKIMYGSTIRIKAIPFNY